MRAGRMVSGWVLIRPSPSKSETPCEVSGGIVRAIHGPDPSALARCGASLRLSKIAPGNFVEPTVRLHVRLISSQLNNQAIPTPTRQEFYGHPRYNSLSWIDCAGNFYGVQEHMEKVMESTEMHRIAYVCGRMAELLRQSLNTLRVKAPSPRQRVAQALLAAGADHAVSLNLLLSRQSDSAAFSAVGLFRLQLDALSRGIFFARSEYSSDAEVDDFLLNDRMPWVQPPGEKKRQIRLSELIERLRDFLADAAPELAKAGLHHRFSYALDDFNGFVHGGSDVVRAYQESERNGLIFAPNFYTLANISLHATTLCVIAEMAQIFYVSEKSTVSFANGKERDEAYAAFVDAGRSVRRHRES
jgi:hypothetical protein